MNFRWLTAAAALLLAACVVRDVPYVSPNQTGLITGTVTYREQTVLPSDSVVEVWVTDVTDVTAALPVVAEVAFLTDGRQVPLAFQLRYDPSMLDRSHAFAASAVIRNNGQILFSSSAPVPVTLEGSSVPLDLLVTPPSQTVTTPPPAS
jgi:putative lipoprotein